MDDEAVDYKELYLKQMRANEAALRILIAAQRECEALYLEQTEEDEKVLRLR